MDYDRVRNAILAVFAAVLFAVVCHIAGRVQGRRIGREQGYEQGYAEGYAAPHPSDTIWTRDTLLIDRPVVVEKWKDKPVLVPVTDTIRRVDTLYMAVEIERKTYQSDDYRAVVSGFRPSLEEIAVYPKTIYLQTEVSQPPAPASRRGPRAGIGIAAGPGAFWTPQAGVQFGAGAVVGLSVTF